MSKALVVVEPYCSSWPEKFRTESLRLKNLLGEWVYGSIEHVGSTAVPNLAAKPVIDIMCGVASLDASRPAIDVLEANGYCYWPYKEDVMHWLCKPSDEHRTHHLHLVPYGSKLWQERIRFRDVLRTHSHIAVEYAALKVSLAVKYSHDRDAYTQNKWPFIKSILDDLESGRIDIG